MSRLEKTVGARSVLLLLLITVLLRFGFDFGFHALFGEESLSQPEIYYTVYMVQGVLVIGLPVFLFIYLLRPRYVPVLKARLGYPPFPMAVRVVLAGMVGTIMLELYSNLWAMLLEQIGVPLRVPEVLLPDNGAQIILAVAALAIFPAVLEELFFRGVLLEGLRREISCKWAVLLTALLFALMHGSILGLPTHLALGLVITLLAVRQNNLQLPMLYHFVHNAVSLVLSLYFRNLWESIEFSAQAAQEIQSQGLAAAIMSILSMAVMLTYIYWRLLRPLIFTSSLPAADTYAAVVPMTSRSRIMTAVLVGVLLLLLLPLYVLSALPA